jgi:hypothetical protein
VQRNRVVHFLKRPPAGAHPPLALRARPQSSPRPINGVQNRCSAVAFIDDDQCRIEASRVSAAEPPAEITRECQLRVVTLGHAPMSAQCPLWIAFRTQVGHLPRTELSRRRHMHRSKDRRYSITSSAMASSPGDGVRLSALAALRLMANSNLVGCRTGRSAGFSPLRMRPT